VSFIAYGRPRFNKLGTTWRIGVLAEGEQLLVILPRRCRVAGKGRRLRRTVNATEPVRLLLHRRPILDQRLRGLWQLEQQVNELDAMTQLSELSNFKGMNV